MMDGGETTDGIPPLLRRAYGGQAMGGIFAVQLRLIASAVGLGPANRGLFWTNIGSPLAGARLAYVCRSEREQARGLLNPNSPVCD